jgi:CheY-like chemotaxis protein
MPAKHPQSVILVVEDEAESRDTLRELLELEGYTVKTAANGRAALEVLETIEPCVVLLDLVMPIMDGWQVIDRLRADGRLAKMKVLVIYVRQAPSARRPAGAREAAQSRQADSHSRRPLLTTTDARRRERRDCDQVAPAP